jgi:hypothetical protein
MNVAYITSMGIKNITYDGKNIDRYAYVRALMTLHRLTNGAIARALNVSTVMVTRVTHGYGQSNRVKRYISDRLSVDFRELWGEEYRPRRAE